MSDTLLKVGLIDVDTTHPWTIANYVNATGRARVVAITDSGATWPRSHVEEFARRLGGARVYDRAADFIGEVDAALLCGTRYDLRLEQAIPWLEAGKTVYLDKPAVGTFADVRVLEGYVQKGARIMAGSSLVYCSELQSVWRHVSAGSPAGVVVVGWRSLLEYGLHCTDVALHLLQSRPRRVRWGVFGPTECVWAELENGQEILLHVGPEAGPWQVTGLTNWGAHTVSLNLNAFKGSHYDGLACAFVNLALTGRTRVPPQWHLEGIKLLIAAKRSRDEERDVDIAELKDDDGFDGKEYAEHYRRLAGSSNPEAYLAPPLAMLLAPRPDPNAEPATRDLMLMLGKRAVLGVLGERGARITKRLLLAAVGARGARVIKRVLGLG